MSPAAKIRKIINIKKGQFCASSVMANSGEKIRLAGNSNVMVCERGTMFGYIFEPYKDCKVDLLGPKFLFIALILGGLALGVWKLNTLGLLPTHVSDWVSSLPPAQCLPKKGGTPRKNGANWRGD